MFPSAPIMSRVLQKCKINQAGSECEWSFVWHLSWETVNSFLFTTMTIFQPLVNFHQWILWGDKSGSEMCLIVDVQNTFSKNCPFTVSHMHPMDMELS